MERGDPVERRGAVISDPPLLRQLGHRMQLILDHTQVMDIDRMSRTDTSCRQTPRTNPATNSLGVPTQPIGSLSDSQHAGDGTPGPGPQKPAPVLDGPVRIAADLRSELAGKTTPTRPTAVLRFTRERSQVRNARGPCEAARPAGRDRQPGPDPLTGHIRAAHGRRVGGRHPVVRCSISICDGHESQHEHLRNRRGKASSVVMVRCTRYWMKVAMCWRD